MSRLKFGVGALIIVVLVLLFTIPYGIKSAVRYAAVQELESFGIKDIDINQVSLSWGSVSIHDIRVKSARGYRAKGREDYLIIKQVEGKFTPLHLITKGFNEIQVHGVSLWIEPENGYFTSFNELDQPIIRSQGSNGKKTPNITIENGDIVIANSHGEPYLHIPVTATVGSEAGKPLVIKAQWSLTGNSSAEGTMNFESNEQGKFEMNLMGKKILLDQENIGVMADDFLFTVKSTTGSDVYDLALKSTINDITVDKTTSFKAPLLLDATANGPFTQLVFKASSKRQSDEKPLFELSGTAAPFKAIAKAKLTVNLPKVQDILDLGKLLAHSENAPQSFSGQLRVDADIIWSKDWTKPAVDAVISGQDIDIVYHDLQGTGVSGNIKVTGITPFATRNHQVLSAKSVRVKTFDMKDAKLEFYASPLGGISVNSLSGALFDGTLSAHSFRKNLKDPSGAITFDTNFKDIQLDDLLKITDIKGLSGSGKVSGSASFKLNTKGIELTRAQIRSSTAQGSIVYNKETTTAVATPTPTGTGIAPAAVGATGTASATPAAAPLSTPTPEGADLALEVLKNLQFTLLDIAVGTAPPPNEADLQAIVKILGYNPKVLNGYPFEFNITTTGKLGDLVLNTLNNLRPPKDLQELGSTIKKAKGAAAQ